MKMRTMQAMNMSGKNVSSDFGNWERLSDFSDMERFSNDPHWELWSIEWVVLDQVYSNARVPTRINTSPTRMSASQNESAPV